ncbi:MAG: ATP-binding cassette domain-containing protein [Candidatus Methanoplasma sp.]|jgi:ABC-2 type transport system ATP-binding protein|nr:ATP-binding cassette domain-containing protein [Candidatus Methanoplasma sp.]
MTMNTDGTSAVEVRNLVKTFGGCRAVDGIDFNIPAGTVCCILGPNGAGKTTVISILATLTAPDSGSVKIFGCDVRKDANKVRRLIGLTGQFASIDEGMTAAENLMIFARLLGFSRKGAKERTKELLEEFSLTEVADTTLSEFSGGMRRRLDIAASLITRPPLIFLDEPTTGLDPRTRAQMWHTIRNLVKNGSTILMTTQYLDEADQLADSIVIIDRGRVIANDTPDGLKKSIGSMILRITVKEMTRAEEAAVIIGRSADSAVPFSEACELTAPIDNTGCLARVLAALKDADIELTEINVTRPTLDEVFFALTGGGEESEDR